MSIAQELRDQEMRLRDPGTTWVRRHPSYRTPTPQACAVMYIQPGRPAHEMSVSAEHFLNQLVEAEVSKYGGIWGSGCLGHHFSITALNDLGNGVTREQIISIIEEAAYWAEEEGL
jgi:hypothetical protein